MTGLFKALHILKEKNFFDCYLEEDSKSVIRGLLEIEPSHL